MITNILYPIDFSPSCVAMAAYVRRAARLLGANVSLIHVVDLTSRNGFELYLRPAQQIAEEHRNIAKQRLDSFLAEEFPLAECPRLLTSGEPATEIARVVREGRFDLIIMPTHAGLFRRMLLGSTTAKVLKIRGLSGIDQHACRDDLSTAIGAPRMALRNRSGY
jgi:nucleotide-binding universal stress UspA family protein